MSSLLPQKWLMSLLTLLLFCIGSGSAWADEYVINANSGGQHASGISTFTINSKTITITSNGKTISNTSKCVINGMKYSRNEEYTITVPEDEQIDQVVFTGISRSATDESYVSHINGILREGDQAQSAKFPVSTSAEGVQYFVPFYSTHKNTVSFKLAGYETSLSIKVTTSYKANGVIGSTDYSTGFNGDHSGDFTINSGESREFTFTCHGTTSENWKNWAMYVHKDESNAEVYTLLNTWPQAYINGGGATPQKIYTSVNGNASELDLSVTAGQPISSAVNTFRNDLTNAEVSVKVSYGPVDKNDESKGGMLYIYAIMRANDRTYVYPYTQTIKSRSGDDNGKMPKSVSVYFTVENSFLTNFDAKTAVGAAAARYRIDYEAGVPDAQKTCAVSMTTPEGTPLVSGAFVAQDDKIVYFATPTPRVTAMGLADASENPRTVPVTADHVTAGEAIPTIKFSGLIVPELSFYPSPYITYVGADASTVGRADINGLPGSGWNHLVTVVDGQTLNNENPVNTGDKAAIATYSATANKWTLGGKAGRITSTVTMTEHDNTYGEASASYDFIVKPGRREGSTAKYSVDFTQYLNLAEIQDAFGKYLGSNNYQTGYFTNVNISNDPNLQLIVNEAPANGGTSNAIYMRSNDHPLYVTMNGAATISQVRIYLDTNGDNAIRYFLNNSNSVQTAEGDVNRVVTINANNAFSIRFICPTGKTSSYIKCVEVEYSAEANFSASSVRYNIADLKKSASEVPQLLGMTNPTYSSANNKIVRVNADGSLVFLKTGKTSITATSGDVSKSYDIEIYADQAEFEVQNDGAKYTYVVTKAGMLPSNGVSSIPGITMTYGGYGETPLVANHQGSSGGNGLGIAVIGSADGNVGKKSVNNEQNPTSGTYYMFTPTISGSLSISGYFEGSHSAWFSEVNNGTVASNYKMALTRDPKALVTGVVNVEAGKTYCLYSKIDANYENYFMLNSFSFTASVKLSSQSYVISDKQNGTNLTLDLKSLFSVEGKGSLDVSYELARVIAYDDEDFGEYKPGGESADDETKKTWVAAQPSHCNNTANSILDDTDGAGNYLNVSIHNGVLSYNSPAATDGGAIVVNVRLSDGSKLPFVVTVPYLGKHIWNFHNMTNKEENREAANWYLDWEVHNGNQVKDPIVIAQDEVHGNNAMLIDQTNGLSINTVGHSRLGLAVLATSTNVETRGTSAEDAQAKRSSKIDIVRNVNLVVLKGATVTIPQVKKDWFVKVHLDPHTGNNHKENGIGNGCEFRVSNCNDLTGKSIDPTDVIMSYGTQWTRSTTFDDKTSFYNYEGCMIFRVAEDGDVTFEFLDNGWDKIVKMEVTDTYSTEMQLGSTNLDGKGNRVVDYKRWNHSWVHREHANGQDEGVQFVYDGHPVSRAENAKPLRYKVVYNHGTVDTQVESGTWTSSGGVTYGKGTFTVTKGVGNVKILTEAPYQAYSYDGGWHAIDGKQYVLNSCERWVVVGKLKEQTYPYTWDFTQYNTTLNHKGTTTTLAAEQANDVRSWNVNGASLTSNSDTTYGYWNNSKTNHLVVKTFENDDVNGMYCSKSDNSPFYTIKADGTKLYNIPISKPTFANGSQLTTGFDAVPETEGLGIILNWANYPAAKEENIVLDGNSLNVIADGNKNNKDFDLLIPNVTKDMYVFVKSDKAPTPSTYYFENIYNQPSRNMLYEKAEYITSADNFGFEPNDAEKNTYAQTGNVYVFKVTKTGDMLLNFPHDTKIYKIGVTNITKNIAYFGYSTESRDVDIDYNETRYFSANMSSFYVTDPDRWYTDTPTGFDLHSDRNVAISPTLTIENQSYIKEGTGIVLRNDEFTYDKMDKDRNSSTSFKVPLFVPACNVPETKGGTDNILKASTSKAKTSTEISTTLHTADVQYYTMSNRYVGVNKDNNQHVTELYYTDIPRFYRFVGSNANVGTTRVLSNAAYLELNKPAGVKSFFDVVKFDLEDDFEEATDIETLEIVDNETNESGLFYNLRGQVINGKPTTSGVYIKNGKKYYVK